VVSWLLSWDVMLLQFLGIVRTCEKAQTVTCVHVLDKYLWQLGRGGYDITNDEERTDNCSNLTNFSPGNGAAQVMLESSV